MMTVKCWDYVCSPNGQKSGYYAFWDEFESDSLEEVKRWVARTANNFHWCPPIAPCEVRFKGNHAYSPMPFLRFTLKGV